MNSLLKGKLAKGYTIELKFGLHNTAQNTSSLFLLLFIYILFIIVKIFLLN